MCSRQIYLDTLITCVICTYICYNLNYTCITSTCTCICYNCQYTCVKYNTYICSHIDVLKILIILQCLHICVPVLAWTISVIKLSTYTLSYKLHFFRTVFIVIQFSDIYFVFAIGKFFLFFRNWLLLKTFKVLALWCW